MYNIYYFFQLSNPIPPHEKEGAAQEKDDEVKRKNKRKH